MQQDRADESAFPSGYGDGDAVQSHSEKHCWARQHEMLSRTSGMDVRGSLSSLLFTDLMFRRSQDQLCNPSLGYLSTLGCRASSTSHTLSQKKNPGLETGVGGALVLCQFWEQGPGGLCTCLTYR